MGVKTSTATMKIMVVVSQETRNRSKSRSRYTTFSHAQSTSYPTTKETTDHHVHCCSSPNNQKLETT